MKKYIGFTLIELMITLIIVGILLVVGIPSFRTFIKDSQLITGTNELVAAMNLARSEAVKRGIRVTVCKSTNQTGCATTKGWEQGWIIFTDENNDATYNATATPPETLIRVHGALAGLITATGNSSITNYVSYIASGQSQQAGGGIQSGTIHFCDDRTGAVGKDLTISTTGRITTRAGVTCP